LARFQLVDVSQRGNLALGRAVRRLAIQRDEMLRREDCDRIPPRPNAPRRSLRANSILGRVQPSAPLTNCAQFRRAPKFRIGFANAAIDSPWRTALVHSVEYAAAKHRGWISALRVRHADQCAVRQAADIEKLLESGVEGLIVSAVTGEATERALREAERRGVPAVLVDRGLPERIPHVSFVTCDDDHIGVTTATWLAELLEGQGRLVLLPGLAEAEPAQRRLDGARRVFGRFPGIAVLATEWTSWSGAKAQGIMEACLETFDEIDGVWCDSGLQAVGSLKAFLRSKRHEGRSPPHTGGDLNLAY
jgi:ABC-type sugar transport system substrate-binding protein